MYLASFIMGQSLIAHSLGGPCADSSASREHERPALLALSTAGRLSLKKLNRPDQALRFYKAADVSTVPHLDWESNIKAGIADAERAMAVPVPAMK